MIRKLRKRAFEIIEKGDDPRARAFQLSIMTLISINVVAVVMETVESFSVRYETFFDIFELFSVIVFTGEYLLRIWSCVENEEFAGSLKGRLRFSFTPLAIVDLLAILPFYLPMIFPVDLRLIRGIRLFRLFRLLKMGRYSQSLRTVAAVFKEKKEELMITVFAVLILLVFASSLLYFVEHEAQPEKFSSIPHSMWWAVAALTTVGYGDVHPITPLGKFLGATIAFLGIGIFALPAGILASGFNEVIQKRKAEPKTCPHCGKDVD